MNQMTKRFIANRYLRQATSEDYVNWAIACLEDGIESKNLGMLAAMEKPYFSSEIDEKFHRALKELGWNYPNEEESLFDSAKETSQRIISGDCAPDEGCGEIYMIARALDYPKELMRWVYLDEGLEPETYEFLYDRFEDNSAQKHDKWFQAIINEAKKLVETDFLELKNDDFRS